MTSPRLTDSVSYGTMNMGLLSGETHYAPVNEHMEASHTYEKTWAVRLSRAVLYTTYGLLAILAGVVIWQLDKRDSERHVIAWAVGALFVGIAVPLSFHEVHMHLLHWESPLQRYYCRILLMVPIYSIESWCALRFRDQALLFATAREAYEALVIRDFFRLLMDALSGGTGDVAVIAAKFRALGKREAHMMFPLCRVRPWRLDTGEFFRRTQLAVFQYVVVRVTLSIAVAIAEVAGTYGEGEWTNFKVLFPWAVLILNVSQFVAMYALVLFYHETAELLEPLHPLGKFLAVKSVVFLSFWQSIILSALVEAGVLQPTLEYSESEIATGLQDFLICIEMAGAAIAHHYTFSVSDFWHRRHVQGALTPADGGGEGVVVTPLAAIAIDAAAASAAAGNGKDAVVKPSSVPLGQAAAQLLPHDIIQEAGQHAVALRAAAAETVVATVATTRQIHKTVMGRGGTPAWSTSSGGVQPGSSGSGRSTPAFTDAPTPPRGRGSTSGGESEGPSRARSGSRAARIGGMLTGQGQDSAGAPVAASAVSLVVGQGQGDQVLSPGFRPVDDGQGQGQAANGEVQQWG